MIRTSTVAALMLMSIACAPAGLRGVGGACTSDADCGGIVCVGGTCTVRCGEDCDCPSGYTCAAALDRVCVLGQNLCPGVPSCYLHFDSNYSSDLETCDCEAYPASIAPVRPHDDPCDSVATGGANCCAMPGWPAMDTYCFCGSPRCLSNSLYCVCDWHSTSGDAVTSCAPRADRFCCLHEDEAVCWCGSQPCGPTQREVSSCTTDLVACTGHITRSCVP